MCWIDWIIQQNNICIIILLSALAIVKKSSILTFNVISSLKIIEKLFIQRPDFWNDKYLYFDQNFIFQEGSTVAGNVLEKLINYHFDNCLSCY